MNKRQKMYMAFLESLKTPRTSALIESVKQAFILAECGNNCQGDDCNDGDALCEVRSLSDDFGSDDLDGDDYAQMSRRGGYLPQEPEEDGYLGDRDPMSPEVSRVVGDDCTADGDYLDPTKQYDSNYLERAADDLLRRAGY